MMRIALHVLALCVLCTAAMPLSLASEAPQEAVIAYLFVKDQAITPDQIAATWITRINYAFANIEHGKIVPGFAHDRENFQVLHSLKQQNPKLEVVVSVGGWTWSGAFSDMALTPASRKIFIESTVQFIRDNQLDGLDIDWEYPGAQGNGNRFRAEDKQNYTALLKELRARFDAEEKHLGRHLVTSIAVGASAEFVGNTEMGKVEKYLDSVNLMSYDYYEPDSDRIAGHHAPLYTNPADPKHISVSASVRMFEQAGVPADKLVLGVPFYGHVWSDAGGANHGLYQPAKKSDQWASYADIAGKLLSDGFVRYWDGVASAPYLYNSVTRTFVSYDDPQSIDLKCQYILEHHLAGIMFWDYSSDTPDHALLQTIHRALAPAAHTQGAP